MPNYAQVYNNRVVTQAFSQNTMIEIPDIDTRKLGTWYIHDRFVGYKIKLAVDKPEITADGQDTVVITATVNHWDQSVAVDFTHDILFTVDEERIPVAPRNGVAVLEFASEEPGVVTISTVNGEDQYVMSNDIMEVAVHE